MKVSGLGHCRKGRGYWSDIGYPAIAEQKEFDDLSGIPNATKLGTGSY